MNKVKSMSLKDFMRKHERGKNVEVTSGTYWSDIKLDISQGQVLKLIRTKTVIIVKFCKTNGMPGELVTYEDSIITIPRNFQGELEVVPDRPESFNCRVVDQLLTRPLPLYITPTTPFQIKGVNIDAGSRLKVIKKNVSPTNEVTLECTQLKDEMTFQIPGATLGNFKLRWEKGAFKVDEIYDRLPQKIKPVNLRGATCIFTESFPGLPDHPFYLDVIDMVEVAVQDSNEKPFLIPVNLDIQVRECDIAPGENIHTLVKAASSTLPMVVKVADDNDGIISGIKNGAMIEICRKEKIRAVLCNTDKAQDLLVPLCYRGQFERVPKVYETAEDLWRGAKLKFVLATKRYRPDNIDLNSVVPGDILRASNILRRTLHEEIEPRDVLLCDKYRSDHLMTTKIQIPMYARCDFKEMFEDDEEPENEDNSSIRDIIDKFSTPLLIQPTKITNDCQAVVVIDTNTTMTLETTFEFSALIARRHQHNDSTYFEIPEFVNLFVRRLDRKPALQTPNAFVPRLRLLTQDQSQYIRNEIIMYSDLDAVPPPRPPRGMPATSPTNSNSDDLAISTLGRRRIPNLSIPRRATMVNENRAASDTTRRHSMGKDTSKDKRKSIVSVKNLLQIFGIRKQKSEGEPDNVKDDKETTAAADTASDDDSVEGYTEVDPANPTILQMNSSDTYDMIDVTYWMLRKLGCNKEDIYTFFINNLQPITIRSRSQNDLEMKYERDGHKVDNIQDYLKKRIS